MSTEHIRVRQCDGVHLDPVRVEAPVGHMGQGERIPDGWAEYKIGGKTYDYCPACANRIKKAIYLDPIEESKP